MRPCKPQSRLRACNVQDFGYFSRLCSARGGANPAGDKRDFFVSRRGSVAAVAQEVSDVLTERGYKVIVQDYDIPLGASFIEAMDEAIKNARDLVILFTRDYEKSPYTRKEFTSFEAERLRAEQDRHIVVLRCDEPAASIAVEK